MKPVRPRPAATLVLLQASGDDPAQTRVLMGRRAPKHDFLPDVFVFPGGRVDESDRGPHAPDRRLHHTVQQKIGGPADRAHTLAAAAIRETFEETGLALLETKIRDTSLPPRPAPGERSSGEWPGPGLTPIFDVLDYIGRAITPAPSPKRFDTYFFAAEARHAQGTITGNGELLDLDWYPLADAFKLPLIDVTEFILGHVADLLQGDTQIGPGFSPTAPFYSWRSGRWLTRTT